MLAIDGPTDIIRAPSGTCLRIHRPASRPPGTPPEPARNVADVAGWILDQLGIASDSTTTATSTGVTRGAYRKCGASTPKSKRASRRAARTATAGAIGSRYW